MNKIFLKYLTVSFIICFLLTSFTNTQAQTNDNKVRLGLVLSGGGAKGWAHIGVLKMFEEENIPISLITGNSIGAVVGGLYSTGYSANDIEMFAKMQDWDMLLSDDTKRRFKSRFKQKHEHKFLLKLDLTKEKKSLSLPSGLVKGNNILNTFCGATANQHDSINFHELPIPFSCVAYNLNTGREEVLNNGYLAKAMLASMAIPGAFSPVEFNDMKLVDGGVVNNFPVDVAKEMGADILIGVNLKQEMDKSEDFESIGSVFVEIINNIDLEKHNQNMELADVVINPDLNGVSMLNFSKGSIDSVIDKGYLAAKEQLPKIKELIKGLNIIQNNSFENTKNKEWLITEIQIPEKNKSNTKFITTHLNIENNTKYTTDEIEEATERLYAYGNFEMVTFKLKPNTNGYILELLIDDKKERHIMLGASLNTVDIAALYVNSSFQNYSNIINLLTVDAKIAVNPQLRFIMETNRLFLSSVGFELNTRYNELNYIHRGKKNGKIDISSISGDLYSFFRYRDVGNLGFGIKQSYFNSDSYGNNSRESFKTNFSGFTTSFYGYFNIDSRDHVNIPNNGLFLDSRFSLLANKGGFSDITPILDFKLNTITHFEERISLLANLYHRSILNDKNNPVSIINYASNTYNAYTDFHFPIMGQGGISFLNNISTLIEVGIRVEIGSKHYLTPKVQTLCQFDKWKNIDLNKLQWSGGLTYQTKSKIGPIDFTLGFREKFKGVNFYGGLGFQF